MTSHTLARPDSAILSWLSGTAYKLKCKARIYWLMIKDMFTNGSIQSAGIMVGVNALTGQISVKIIMVNGDSSICAMNAEGAECLMEDLRMAITSVSIK